MTITLTELEFERIGRLYGELVSAQVQVLQARIAMLEAELARRDSVVQDGPGAAFNAEMQRLATAYGFSVDLPWRLDASTHSLVLAGGDQSGGSGTP